VGNVGYNVGTYNLPPSEQKDNDPNEDVWTMNNAYDKVNKRMSTYPGNKMHYQSHEATDFEKWQGENTDQNLLRDMFGALFAHGALTAPSNNVYNGVSGLPQSKFAESYEGLQLQVQPETTYFSIEKIDTVLRWDPETKKFRGKEYRHVQEGRVINGDTIIDKL
jgi:hypothetical protein